MMRDTVEVLVGVQWTRVLGTAPRDIDEDFFDAGGNSLQAARLVAALGSVMTSPVDLGTVFEARSVRGISQWLRTGTESQGRLVTLNPTVTGVPLMLLPSGGGGVIGLQGLGAAALGRPVHATTARGLRVTDGEPLGSLAEMTTDFASLLRSSDLPRRLHLGGFCAGGIFAYELARQLVSEGWQIDSVHLFNTSLYCPAVDPDEVIRDRLRGLTKAAGLAADEVPLRPEAVFDLLTRSDQVDLVETDYAAFLARLRVAALIMNSVAGYVPEPIDVPVRLFSAPDRDIPENVAAVGALVADWDDIGLTDFQRVDVPVGHYRMLQDDAVLNSVARSLTACEN